MNMRLKPALNYELRNMLLSSASFFAVIVVIVIVSVFATGINGSSVSFNGYCVASTICLFVFGIVEPRSCLRLCAQLGVSRRSAFIGNLAAAVATALALAVAGEFLLALGRFISGGKLFIADLYQIIYLGDWDTAGAPLTAVQHLMSIVFNTLLMISAYCGGMFLSCLFWRLNKIWTVVTAVSIPVLLNLIPLLIYRSAAATRVISAFFSWTVASVGNLLSIFVLLGLICAVIAWLLVRKANIKAPTSK